MYLYVGSIVAIMCIYISVLIDNCPSLTGSGGSHHAKELNDPEAGSIASFGTLRRAHISRNKVSRTSFYLRVGALGKQFKFETSMSTLPTIASSSPENCKFNCAEDFLEIILFSMSSCDVYLTGQTHKSDPYGSEQWRNEFFGTVWRNARCFVVMKMNSGLLDF